MCPYGELSLFGKMIVDKYLPGISGLRIVDVGCGHGQVINYCRSRGANVIGIDFAMNALLQAQSFSSDHLIQANGASLPLATSEVDAVLSFEALEHFPNQEKALAEMHRVLKDNGKLIISTPNYFNCAGLLKLLIEASGCYETLTWAPFSDWRPQVYESYTTWNSMHHKIAKAGFQIDDSFTINLLHGIAPIISFRWSFYCSSPIRFLRHLIERLLIFEPFKRLGMNVFIIAHKKA